MIRRRLVIASRVAIVLVASLLGLILGVAPRLLSLKQVAPLSGLIWSVGSEKNPKIGLGIPNLQFHVR